jgi:glycosyltransferase involved in cell wall biosynthesis
MAVIERVLVAKYYGVAAASIDRCIADLVGGLEERGILTEEVEAPWWPVVRPGARRRRDRMLSTARRLQPDVVHFMDGFIGWHIPRFSAWPTVVTVHDVIPFITPRYHQGALPGWLDTWMLGHCRGGVRAASAVIAVSTWSKETLMEWAEVDPARIFVIPNQVVPSFRPIENAEDQLLHAGIRLPAGPRILALGASGPRKNLELLIHALARPGLEHVTLVRASQPLSQRQKKLAGRLEVANRIIELGTVAESAVPALYSACGVLAQPSLSEGFGLPVAEAMACGLPVVTSDGGALPEVVGDAGVVVGLRGQSGFGSRPNPDTVSEFAGALERVLGDPAHAADLSARGLRRAEAFRPAAVMPQVLRVYESIQGTGRRDELASATTPPLGR